MNNRTLSRQNFIFTLQSKLNNTPRPESLEISNQFHRHMNQLVICSCKSNNYIIINNYN